MPSRGPFCCTALMYTVLVGGTASRKRGCGSMRAAYTLSAQLAMRPSKVTQVGGIMGGTPQSTGLQSAATAHEHALSKMIAGITHTSLSAQKGTRQCTRST